MSSRGGYRGDGAFGQYCFILPDRGIVAAALCEAENLQHAVDIVHEMALELFDEPFGEGDVERMAEEFYAMPRTETPEFDPPRYFKMEENPFGITYIKLDTAGDDFVFAVADGFSLTNIRCGNGVWRHNRASFEQTFLPNAPAFPVQTSERTAGIAAAYTNENGVLRAELRCRYSPHHLTVTFAPGADGLTVSVSGYTRGGLHWTRSWASRYKRWRRFIFAALREGARIPAKRDEDAGYDIYACFEEPYFRFEPFETKLVPSGIISAFPPEYVAVLKERGSTGSRGIGQRAGVIDSGYRGEWLIAMTNHNDRPLVIAKGGLCRFSRPVGLRGVPLRKGCLSGAVPPVGRAWRGDCKRGVDPCHAIGARCGRLGSSGK